MVVLYKKKDWTVSLKCHHKTNHVYAPHLVSEQKCQEGVECNLERLLPAATAGWVRKAWETSEEEFLSTAGLDAFVFMRIFVFRWVKLFNGF